MHNVHNNLQLLRAYLLHTPVIYNMHSKCIHNTVLETERGILSRHTMSHGAYCTVCTGTSPLNIRLANLCRFLKKFCAIWGPKMGILRIRGTLIKPTLFENSYNKYLKNLRKNLPSHFLKIIFFMMATAIDFELIHFWVIFRHDP